MKFGIIVFPGSNCDHDAFYAVANNLGQPAEFIWHDSTSLGDIDAVILRYIDNANGSMRYIAAVLNKQRNVMGMMPHPERATEPLMGSTDGLLVFESMLRAAVIA